MSGFNSSSSPPPPLDTTPTLASVKRRLSCVSSAAELKALVSSLLAAYSSGSLTSAGCSSDSSLVLFLAQLLYQNASLLMSAPSALSADPVASANAILCSLPFPLRYRLSSSILSYSYSALPTSTGSLHRRFCRAVDAALPPSLFSLLVSHFVGSPSAGNYFSSHRYSDGFGGDDGSPATPYFSYVSKLSDVLDADGAPTSNSVWSHLLSSVFSHCKMCSPAIGSRAQFVEFWAHSRPHCSGHQLHFDSDDEGQTGGPPSHPLCSAVLYLTPSDCGGPTLVTGTKLSSKKVSQSAWLIPPRPNRLAAFDGALLHGVIPGHGPCPSASSAAPASASSAPNAPPLEAQPASSQPLESESPCRRVTLMFAFWSFVRVRSNGEGGGGGNLSGDMGACRAMPKEGVEGHSWTDLFCGEWEECVGGGEGVGGGEEVMPLQVPEVFVDVDKEANEREGIALDKVKMPGYDSIFMF